MGARKQHDRKIPNNHMFLLCGCAAVVLSLLMDISETKFYKFLVWHASSWVLFSNSAKTSLRFLTSLEDVSLVPNHPLYQPKLHSHSKYRIFCGQEVYDQILQ